MLAKQQVETIRGLLCHIPRYFYFADVKKETRKSRESSFSQERRIGRNRQQRQKGKIKDVLVSAALANSTASLTYDLRFQMEGNQRKLAALHFNKHLCSATSRTKERKTCDYRHCEDSRLKNEKDDNEIRTQRAYY